MLTGSVHASDRYIDDRVIEPGAERERDRRPGRRDQGVDPRPSASKSALISVRTFSALR